jgi:hypothetical protein
MRSHASGPLADDAATADASDGDDRRPAGTGWADRRDPNGQADRHQACESLIAAYAGDTYRLLTDLADQLGASVAYVDRPTIEAHLERPLSDAEWSRIAARFTPMASDEHVGDAGTIRTDWIDDVLLRANVPGRALPVSHRSGPPPRPTR